MKRLLLALLVLSSLIPAFAEKNTVVLHPGDTIYARFEVKGKKIRLISASSEKDEGAQAIFVFEKELKGMLRVLRVENKFPSDLVYKVEMRSLSRNHQARGRPTPVVGGKMAFDTYPVVVEELALWDFKIQP